MRHTGTLSSQNPGGGLKQAFTVPSYRGSSKTGETREGKPATKTDSQSLEASTFRGRSSPPPEVMTACPEPLRGSSPAYNRQCWSFYTCSQGGGSSHNSPCTASGSPWQEGSRAGRAGTKTGLPCTGIWSSSGTVNRSTGYPSKSLRHRHWSNGRKCP